MAVSNRAFEAPGPPQSSAPTARRVPLLLASLASLVGAAVLLPLVYLLVRAIQGGSAPWESFLRMRTVETLLATALLALAVTAATILISLPLAWLFARTDLPRRRTWLILAMLPLAIPSYVAGFAVIAGLGPQGFVHQALETIFGLGGIPGLTGFPGALFTLTVISYPYVLITTTVALTRIDPATEEAARSLGAGPWRTFFTVTVPQLRPALTAGGLLVALYTLSDFGAVSLMRFNSFTQVIYTQYQASFDRSLAALLGLLLVLLTVGILFLERRTRGKARFYRSSAGTPQRARLIRLERWKWPALIYCGAVIVVALLIPIGTLIYWSVRGVGSGGVNPGIWAAAGNSALASGLAGIAAVAAALPIAAFVTRYRRRFSSVLEGIAYSGYALPGVVLALSLVFFAANYAPIVYQSLFLLVFAYVVRFLPQAFGSIRASFLQVSPRLEESARAVGRGRFSALKTVTIPLIRPGILAGGALVFLTAMKELPATLLLGPTGFQTLATQIWSATDEGFFAAAGPAALLLVALASLPMILLFPRMQETR
jgi:iron(III) transport system permease protein